MLITPDQCRAARALLNWTQDQLAVNARVTRPTIKDFENSNRRPLQNNIVSMKECFEAAGIEFIPENGAAGVGLRFSERKLQYVSAIREIEGNAEMRMVYAGEDFICLIPLDVLQKRAGRKVETQEDVRLVASDMLHHILVAAAEQCKKGIQGGEIALGVEAFDPAVFEPRA